MSDTDESALRDEWMKSFARPRKSTFSRDADGRYVNRFVEEDWQSYRRDTHPLAAAVLQQEAGEPVAWGIFALIDGRWALQFPAYGSQHLAKRDLARFLEGIELDVRPLYTTPQVSPPQARVPLTDEQIVEMATTLPDPASRSGKQCLGWGVGFSEESEHYRPNIVRATTLAFARAIERAHLTGLETKGDGNG